MSKIRKYVINILLSLDQFLNVLFGGDPDETISSRCGKILSDTYSNSKFCIVCKVICIVLDKIDPQHCKLAVEKDEGNDRIVD